MSDWDSFTGGQEANERTQRKIDDWKLNRAIIRCFHIFYAVATAAIVVCLYMLMDGAR